MEEASKEITAFTTPFGHYQYRVMTFGLVNSGATYARVMRKLLKDLLNIDNFVDDVMGHTIKWKAQLEALRCLFQRILNAGLTIKPSKCYFGYPTIDFTGHQVGQGLLRTQEDKVQKVNESKAPQTKKQLRSLLGLTGYYRKFIPNYAAKTKVLTDLTRKDQPDQLKWRDEHDQAFRDLKDELSSDAILKLPDVQQPFVVRTDASDVGLGAVFLQNSRR